MKKCVKCGYENENDARFCEGCGNRFAEENKGSKLLWHWLVLAIVVVAIVIGLLFFFLKDDDKNQAAENVLSQEAEVTDIPEEKEDQEVEIIVQSNVTEVPEPDDPDEESRVIDIVPDTEDVPQITEQESVPTQDLEDQIQEIRDIYYGIQDNLDSFTVQDGGGGTTRYLDSNGNIVKISAEKGTYYDIETGDDYAGEFYYEIVNGKYFLRFVFIWGNGEEYRIYLNKQNECIRFIDTVGTVFDNEMAAEQLGAKEDLMQFCSYAQLEVAWAFGG